MRVIDRIAARLLHNRLGGLRNATLTIVLGDSTVTFGDGGALRATIRVHDPRLYRAVILGGHLGAAEAYFDGWWDADDLTAVVRILVRNRRVLDDLETGLARLAWPIRQAWHAANRNTRSGSRRNIAAHYDLGNDFFAQFLDDTLTYSCGIFEHPDSTLRDASLAKYDRICQKLEINPDDHVLEIGTGWGGFALFATEHYGCRVTGTTISNEQYAFAKERAAKGHLRDRITLLLRDYRDLTGRFTKLVSIEMIEAVGHPYIDVFFEKCASLLERGGAMALQAITVPDEYYDRLRRDVDFIKRYIFPGSCLPSLALMRRAAERHGLSLHHFEDIAQHYAVTLRRWRHNFLAHWDRLRQLGLTEEFRRLWDFYFCYCEGGFSEGFLGDVQLIFHKPAQSRVPGS